MNRLVRTAAVLAILIGQLAASAQALAVGDCHEMAPAHDSAGAEHVLHGHEGSAAHGEDARAREGPSDSGDSADCHCASGLHCGQFAAIATDHVAAKHAPADDSWYPTALLQRPMLAHRRELDRPPA